MYDIFVMNFQNRMGKDLFRYGIPRHAKETRYFGTHLETIRRCVAKAKTEYVWVVSSICDYTVFDFHWKPAPWEAKQIHCWASHTQKFGDTFLIPVEDFKKQEPLEKLEWFEDVHYHYPGVQRHNLPITTTNDVIQAANDVHHYYTVIEHGESENAPPIYPPYPNLWERRAVYPLNKSGSLMAVPRDCKGKISKQIYDYPYISYDLDDHVRDKPLDVVFIENGEKNADKHWNRLYDKLRCSHKLHNVSGVKGRTQAYQAAASKSETAWFFAVFAKCEIVDEFDWDWQPDYMQEPKHYIFHAKNPVNGLEYGHMAVIAYNRDLVLNPKREGLDFTLAAEHATIPELSCIARYNVDPVVTWRTAFREVLKLQQTVEERYTVEAEYRLHKWSTVGEGEFGEWSVNGAKDAVDYYWKVKGNPRELQKSYEWEWLDGFFKNKYPQTDLQY